MKSELSILKLDETRTGRRFAISDIHGCSQTFIKLIKEGIKLQKEDQLFLLGDYINRGPDSVGVFDFIYQMLQDGFQIYILRGNHEHQFIVQYQRYIQLNLSKSLVSSRMEQFIDKKGLLIKKYEEIFNLMGVCIELKNFYLVHAGFNFAHEDPLQDFHSMLEVRNMPISDFLFNEKRIIHGHTPISLSRMVLSTQKKSPYINIDNACSFVRYAHPSYMKPEFGHLCALNLDSLALTTVPYCG